MVGAFVSVSLVVVFAVLRSVLGSWGTVAGWRELWRGTGMGVSCYT